jgi:hypothetical protein
MKGSVLDIGESKSGTKHRLRPKERDIELSSPAPCSPFSVSSLPFKSVSGLPLKTCLRESIFYPFTFRRKRHILAGVLVRIIADASASNRCWYIALKN